MHLWNVVYCTYCCYCDVVLSIFDIFHYIALFYSNSDLIHHMILCQRPFVGLLVCHETWMADWSWPDIDHIKFWCRSLFPLSLFHCLTTIFNSVIAFWGNNTWILMKSDLFRWLASRSEINLMRTKNRSGSSRCRYVLLDIGSCLIEFKGASHASFIFCNNTMFNTDVIGIFVINVAHDNL